MPMGAPIGEKYPQPPSVLAHAALPWPLMACAYVIYVGFWLLMVALIVIVGACLLVWGFVYYLWLRVRAAQ